MNELDGTQQLAHYLPESHTDSMTTLTNTTGITMRSNTHTKSPNLSRSGH